MRIVDIRETAIPLNSTLANSSFNFSEMTTSVVAVITDVMRAGKPVCGFAFNSTGRYACGAQMRARFIPRILKAKPETLLDDAGLIAPDKCLAAMMQNEKSGGHSERSVGIGTIEVAIWDALAKIADKPLHVLLAERFNGGKRAEKVFCYVGGGWYAPGKTTKDLQDEMRGHLDAGYTMVKMKVGGMALADDLARVEAVKSILPKGAQLAVDANSKFDRDDALRLCAGLAPFVLTLVRGAVRSARLRAARRDRRRLRAAAVDRREPVLDAGRGKPGALRRPASPSATTSSRSTRRRPTASCNTRARSTCSRATAGRVRAMFPHGGNQMSLAIAAGFGLGGAESYPGVFGDFGGFADDATIANGYISLSDRPGIGFEGQARLYKIMRELAA